MAKLCIIREINSAHGSHIHGHTFRIEIHFQDRLINNMVGDIDFHELEPKIDKVISKLDKVYLDDIIKSRATIENIAIYILKELQEFKNLYSVVVFEGPMKYVEIFREEVI